MILLLTTALAACPPEEALSHRAELYFGRNRDGKPYVTHARWEAFLDEVVTPVFPGFTVIEGLGYWQGAPERSRVMVLLHAPGDDAKVDAVADAYRVRFGQDAVYVADAPVVTRVCAEE